MHKYVILTYALIALVCCGGCGMGGGDFTRDWRVAAFEIESQIGNDVTFLVAITINEGSFQTHYYEIDFDGDGTYEESHDVAGFLTEHHIQHIYAASGIFEAEVHIPYLYAGDDSRNNSATVMVTVP